MRLTSIHLRRMSRLAVLALGTIALLSTVAPAQATTVLYQDLGQLVSASDAVVLGTVYETVSEYSPDKEIYTFTVFGDLEVLKGDFNKNELVLRQLGGAMPEDVLTLVGAPQFEAGDKVLLFLDGNGHNIVPFVGMTQGVLRIDGDYRAPNATVRDYEGNRVLGLIGNDLAKENLYDTDLEVLGKRGKRGTRASGGVADDGSEVIDLNAAAAEKALVGGEMKLGDLVHEIQQRAKLAPKSARPLESVELFSFPTQEGLDAIAAASQPTPKN